MQANSHAITVRRAALPELLFTPDVAVALQCTPSTARRSIARGDCGPYLRVGRRFALLRETFLDALTRRQIAPLSAMRGEAPRA